MHSVRNFITAVLLGTAGLAACGGDHNKPKLVYQRQETPQFLDASEAMLESAEITFADQAQAEAWAFAAESNAASTAPMHVDATLLNCGEAGSRKNVRVNILNDILLASNIERSKFVFHSQTPEVTRLTAAWDQLSRATLNDGISLDDVRRGVTLEVWREGGTPKLKITRH